MSKRKSEQTYVLRPLSEEKQKQKGYWTDVAVGIFSKAPESMPIMEIYRMTREMYNISKETTKQQLKLQYCLYTVLFTFTIVSAVLAGVFYLIGMTSIGLSFLGPVATGLIGLIVVLVSARK